MKCFACDKKLVVREWRIVDTRDGQTVYVGPDCLVKIKKAGESGYQPPKGGPRLYPIKTLWVKTPLE